MRTSWRFTHHRDMKNSVQHTKWRYKRRNGKSSHCDIQCHCIAGSYSLNGYPFFNFARVIFFVSIWFSKFICADVFVCLSVGLILRRRTYCVTFYILYVVFFFSSKASFIIFIWFIFYQVSLNTHTHTRIRYRYNVTWLLAAVLSSDNVVVEWRSL